MSNRLMWKGSNLAEIKLLLTGHVVTVEAADDKAIRLLGPVLRGDGGPERTLDTLVRLGDEIEVVRAARGHVDSIVIHRPPEVPKTVPLVWRGDNLEAVRTFVAQWGLRVEARGERLLLTAEDGQVTHIRRGDILEKRQGRFLFVSRAGVDHRA